MDDIYRKNRTLWVNITELRLIITLILSLIASASNNEDCDFTSSNFLRSTLQGFSDEFEEDDEGSKWAIGCTTEELKSMLNSWVEWKLMALDIALVYVGISVLGSKWVEMGLWAKVGAVINAAISIILCVLALACMVLSRLVNLLDTYELINPEKVMPTAIHIAEFSVFCCLIGFLTSAYGLRVPNALSGIAFGVSAISLALTYINMIKLKDNYKLLMDIRNLDENENVKPQGI